MRGVIILPPSQPRFLARLPRWQKLINIINPLFCSSVTLLMSIQTFTASTANLVLVKSENRLAVKVILKFFERFRLKPIITLHATLKQIVLTKQLRHYGILFMKMFIMWSIPLWK